MTEPESLEETCLFCQLHTTIVEHSIVRATDPSLKRRDCCSDVWADSTPETLEQRQGLSARVKDANKCYIALLFLTHENRASKRLLYLLQLVMQEIVLS